MKDDTTTEAKPKKAVPKLSPAAAELQLIPATELLELLGGISDMTLWRWMQAGTFPAPVVVGGNRHRFWRISDIRHWQEEGQREAESIVRERTSPDSETLESSTAA